MFKGIKCIRGVFLMCYEKISLAKHLNKHGISFQHLNTFSTPMDKAAIEQLFLVDLRCPEYSTLLWMADQNMLFKQIYRWLVIVGENTTFSTSLDILVDSKVYLVEKSSISTYSLRSIYKISSRSQEYIINDIATWIADSGFQYYNRLSVTRNRTNLMGTMFNISYVIVSNDSLNHLWDYRYGHIDGVTKLNYILSHHVTDFMNASRNFLITNTWGYLNKTTNTYGGLIGHLQSGLAEFSGSPSFFTQDRVAIVDYIGATTPTRAKFIFRDPPLSYVKNVFKLPFDEMVWYASFLLLGIISFVLYAIVKWEWSEPKFEKVLLQRQDCMRPRYGEVLLMELGAVCQQGSETEPRSASGKIATIFVFLTLMAVYTSYSAKIVALLQSTSDSIQTVDDLLNSRIKLGVELTPYSVYYSKTQTQKTRKAIYEQKIAPPNQEPNFMTAEVGIRKMRDEFFAFHIECGVAYKLVGDTFQESQKCGLREIDYWQIIDPWVTIRKNSSYKELAKLAYRKIHESGIQNRDYNRLYTRKPVCQSKGSNFISIGLIDCYFPFLIFGVGSAISVGMLFLELLYRHRFSQIIERRRNLKTN